MSVIKAKDLVPETTASFNRKFGKNLSEAEVATVLKFQWKAIKRVAVYPPPEAQLKLPGLGTLRMRIRASVRLLRLTYFIDTAKNSPKRDKYDLGRAEFQLCLLKQAWERRTAVILAKEHHNEKYFKVLVNGRSEQSLEEAKANS
jgi:hypothetical protein